jgi:hypothetical protein
MQTICANWFVAGDHVIALLEHDISSVVTFFAGLEENNYIAFELVFS